MSGINRRDFMAVSAGVTALAAAANVNEVKAADTSGLIVCMHGITSSEFDFRTCMEGWAKAGVTAAEPDLVKAREFEAANGPGSARRLMDDLGLVAYSSTNQLRLDETSDARVQAVDDLKWKVAMAESLGATRLVIPSTASAEHVLADYEELKANLYEC
ncbi:MAG: hypothetical protein SV422_10130, partial [Pseudomonadota bacterium]|nr:hypothetical protein [Pseudomonadota bacterium]